MGEQKQDNVAGLWTGVSPQYPGQVLIVANPGTAQQEVIPLSPAAAAAIAHALRDLRATSALSFFLGYYAAMQDGAALPLPEPQTLDRERPPRLDS